MKYVQVNNKHTRTTVFIVNFEHISHLVVVFLLLTLNMKLPAGKYHRTICLNSTWIYPKELHNSEYLVHLVHYCIRANTKRDKGTTPIRRKVLVRFKRSRGVFNLQVQVFVKLAKVFRSFPDTKKFLISNWDGGPIIYFIASSLDVGEIPKLSIAQPSASHSVEIHHSTLHGNLVF